jgi:hypothetical protein
VEGGLLDAVAGGWRSLLDRFRPGAAAAGEAGVTDSSR